MNDLYKIYEMLEKMEGRLTKLESAQSPAKKTGFPDEKLVLPNFPRGVVRGRYEDTDLHSIINPKNMP